MTLSTVFSGFESSDLLGRIPGLVHGFSTRAAASPSELRSPTGPCAGLVTVRQVHGDAIVSSMAASSTTEADALVQLRSDGPGMVGVWTADCVPILLADLEGRAVAAIHSGWRGTKLAIAAKTVGVLAEVGVTAEGLVAALGPSISVEAFEVGEEVADHFAADQVTRRAEWRRPHLDLRAIIEAQLRAAGLRAKNIERVGACTFANPEKYHSFRRDGQAAGRHLSFVGIQR